MAKQRGLCLLKQADKKTNLAKTATLILIAVMIFSLGQSKINIRDTEVVDIFTDVDFNNNDLNNVDNINGRSTTEIMFDDASDFVNRTGDSMTGNLDMEGNNITNIGYIISVDSDSLVNNLNSDYLDGEQGSYYLDDTDTNAATICNGNDVLAGDGTCQTPAENSDAETECTGDQYLAGDGTCKTVDSSGPYSETLTTGSYSLSYEVVQR